MQEASRRPSTFSLFHEALKNEEKYTSRYRMALILSNLPQNRHPVTGMRSKTSDKILQNRYRKTGKYLSL